MIKFIIKFLLIKKLIALKNKEDESLLYFGDGKSIKYYNLQSFLIYINILGQPINT